MCTGCRVRVRDDEIFSRRVLTERIPFPGREDEISHGLVVSRLWQVILRIILRLEDGRDPLCSLE